MICDIIFAAIVVIGSCVGIVMVFNCGYYEGIRVERLNQRLTQEQILEATLDAFSKTT